MAEVHKTPHTMTSPDLSATPPPAVSDTHFQSDRMWAVACHASALFGFLAWVPAANVVGPLILWLFKKKELPLVAYEGKSALNFQLSMTVYYAVALGLAIVFTGLWFLLFAPLVVANIVCIVCAMIKVYNAEKFHYPASIQFIK